MNIMIINHYAGNEKYGMEFRPYYLGRELVKMGHEVTIIAADHSHLRKENPIIEESFQEEITDGVRYVFVKTPDYKKNDAKRFLNMVSFLNQLKSNAKTFYSKYTPDAIVASSTYPYDVKAAKRIANFGENVRVCYEIHDIWPLSLIELYKISPQNLYMQSLQRAENYAYENADTVISILPNVNRHIEELGFHDVDFIHIPNGVVIDKAEKKQPPEFIEKEIAKLREKGKFIVMYLGGFSKANALEEFIECSQYLEDNIQLVLIGGGPLWDECAKQAKNNVSVLPSVAKPFVQSTLILADALYIGAKRSKLYQYGVGMNKIFDYMLAAKPIIYGIDSSNDIIKEAQCGITIQPENSKAIADAIKELSGMSSSMLSAMGQSGYEYVLNNHDYKKLAEQFLVAVSKGSGAK